ncbi:hypothetical protein [Alkaliphilus serpentinus]|uniref:Nucleotidyltransferase domain-containing protein n=1 Tax=Alkaliphilus serpentinus TaxID=1482731 RepID=A0A833M789_9FIRM|nr:hypothetical protein [Alkaliphilus serpentinus]KAB3529862.1 hypothetical protein F8153_08670 [Alkaliphilus serpentinus]
MDSIEIKQRNIILNKKDILEKLDYEEEDIIFLGGSLIEGSINKLSNGMGNKLSDIDVFILSNDIKKIQKSKLDYDKEYLKTQFKRLCSISLDIEIYSKQVILDLIEQLNNCDFNTNIRTFNLLNLPVGFDLNSFTSFIHRFLNGIPVYNEEVFYQISNFLKRDNYFKLMVRLAVNNVDVFYEDAIGNIQNHQYEVALVVARNILLETMKAYIFNKKTSLDRDKWIPLKLKNLGLYDEEVETQYKTFAKLYYEEKLDERNNIRLNVEKIINFSNEIIQKIGQDGGI